MAYISFQPNDYFNTVLWTGNSGSQTISGYGFQPDFLWTKVRSHADAHQLRDAVRGINKVVRSNTTGVEYTVTSAGTFNSDGFTTVGTDGGEFNYNSYTFASWGWKANGQGSSNTAGSINTTYTSANTTSGFSISTYTGTGSNATIGHGLGVAPKVVIIKNITRAEDWLVGHNSIGFTKFVSLNLTNAEQTSSNKFNDTAPTNQVFSVGTSDGSNKSGDSHVAYCFAEKKGFSKFGSYSGNGNADGVYQHLGFSASWLMIKRTDSTASWVIFDNKRLGYNVANYQLYSNSTSGEGNNVLLDITSQGFKCRANHLDVNGSGASYIFMAFASEPLVSSNGIPAVAR